MNQYFFILGRTPLLSAWEIISVWPIVSQKMHYSQDFLIGRLENNFDAEQAIKNLGGTIKTGRIIGQIEKEKLGQTDQWWPLIEPILIKHPRPLFGLSYYCHQQETRDLTRTWGIKIKRQLKEKGISSRLVISKQAALSSVVIAKNKLITKGAEFVLLPVENMVYLGLTEAVQDFEEYSSYDYGRPARDSQSGMLPPKLAKIMINLARLPKDKLLLDPFCGSGTIIQAAMLLGYKNIVGSDISAKAVSDSQKNIEWLSNRSGKMNPDIKIIKADYSDIFKQIPRPAGIITEPYLGPPNWRADNLKAVIKELSALYLGLFQSAGQALHQGSPVVIVFPVWQDKSRKVFLPIISKIQELGFSPDGFTIADKRYDSVIYERPDQRVRRQIFIFRKK